AMGAVIGPPGEAMEELDSPYRRCAGRADRRDMTNHVPAWPADRHKCLSLATCGSPHAAAMPAPRPTSDATDGLQHNITQHNDEQVRMPYGVDKKQRCYDERLGTGQTSGRPRPRREDKRRARAAIIERSCYEDPQVSPILYIVTKKPKYHRYQNAKVLLTDDIYPNGAFLNTVTSLMAWMVRRWIWWTEMWHLGLK
ncbi:hypothetical protein THAOC_00962, partial [Thalassiosira oceanica]